MPPEIIALCHKAEDSLAAAALLAEANHLDFAAGRVYFALYYLLQAVLRRQGIEATTDHEVHDAFMQEFVQRGLVDRHTHESFLMAFQMQQIGDYGGEQHTITPEQFRALVQRSKQFQETMLKFLKPE